MAKTSVCVCACVRVCARVCMCGVFARLAGSCVIAHVYAAFRACASYFYISGETVPTEVWVLCEKVLPFILPMGCLLHMVHLLARSVALKLMSTDLHALK